MSLPQAATQLCWLVMQPVTLQEAPEATAPAVLLLLLGAHLYLPSEASPSGPWLEVIYKVTTEAGALSIGVAGC